MTLQRIVSVVLVFILVCCVQCSPIIVQTESGAVQGYFNADNSVRIFKGIPFARANRFENPTAFPSWGSSVRDASQFGDACPQKCVLPTGLCAETYSENCLNLNIYTPNLNGSFPVLVFIPGGHFDMGTGNCLLYDGTEFAKREQIVYVAINYRLGSLGFLVNKHLNISGNFGLFDQRFALEWVQRNIEKFGGNSKQVTIVGESAGAASVVAHLISKTTPLSLFQRAIVQSMPFALPYRTLDSLNILGNSFVSKINCNSKECLASKTVTEVLAAQVAAEDANHNLFHLILNFLPWTPAIDGVHLTQNALDSFAKGESLNVPILMGTTAEEGNMFVYLAFSGKLSKLEYNGIVAAFFLKHYWSIINMYPSTTSQTGDQRETFSILGTDYIFICPSRHAAQLLGKQQSNTYLYLFDHVLSFKAWGDRYPFCEGHVCHGAELAILFGNAPLCKFNVTQDEQVYTQMMMDYWGNFIRTGNPNNALLPSWPSVSSNPLELMYFGPTTQQVKSISSFKQQYCDAWDQYGYKFDW